MKKYELIKQLLEDKPKMKDLVNRKDWQDLRKSLVGTWSNNPEESCRKLRSWLGTPSTASEEKLRIMMNYLTGTGFRTGRIKHKCIASLRKEVSVALKNKKI